MKTAEEAQEHSWDMHIILLGKEVKSVVPTALDGASTVDGDGKLISERAADREIKLKLLR